VSLVFEGGRLCFKKHCKEITDDIGVSRNGKETVGVVSVHTACHSEYGESLTLGTEEGGGEGK